MEIIQKKLSKMEIFCYIPGDAASGECILIDPAFDEKAIWGVVGARGWRVKLVINTHSHPDHSAGNAEIMRRTGAVTMGVRKVAPCFS